MVTTGCSAPITRCFADDLPNECIGRWVALSWCKCLPPVRYPLVRCVPTTVHEMCARKASSMPELIDRTRQARGRNAVLLTFKHRFLLTTSHGTHTHTQTRELLSRKRHRLVAKNSAPSLDITYRDRGSWGGVCTVYFVDRFWNDHNLSGSEQQTASFCSGRKSVVDMNL